MKNAISKALKDLDGLGESAIRKRILGLKDEGDDAPADGEAGLVEEGAETDPNEAGSAENETELDPEMRKKLEELLSQ